MPAGQLLVHPVEGGHQDAGVVLGQDPGRGQAPDVGPRTRQVVGGQPLVERQADGEGQQLLGRPFVAEAALPERHVRPRASGRGRVDLAGGPGGDAEAPQPHESLGVLVAEAVGRLVGGQGVVVEPDLAAPAGDDAAARQLAAQPHLAGHEPLALVDEGVERLLERREPQPVVDQLGVPGLEPGLLVGQVPLQGQVLEVGVGHQQGQGARDTRRPPGS